MNYPARVGMALTAVMLFLSFQDAQAAIPQHRREALIALYNSTNGAGWTNNNGWLGAPGTECDCYGVACDRNLSNLQGLFLDSNQLSGGIPSATNALETQRRNAAGTPISGFGFINTRSVASPARNGQIGCPFQLLRMFLSSLALGCPAASQGKRQIAGMSPHDLQNVVTFSDHENQDPTGFERKTFYKPNAEIPTKGQES